MSKPRFLNPYLYTFSLYENPSFIIVSEETEYISTRSWYRNINFLRDRVTLLMSHVEQLLVALCWLHEFIHWVNEARAVHVLAAFGYTA